MAEETKKKLVVLMKKKENEKISKEHWIQHRMEKKNIDQKRFKRTKMKIIVCKKS